MNGRQICNVAHGPFRRLRIRPTSAQFVSFNQGQRPFRASAHIPTLSQAGAGPSMPRSEAKPIGRGAAARA
jgi:hypothetical protein